MNKETVKHIEDYLRAAFLSKQQIADREGVTVAEVDEVMMAMNVDDEQEAEQTMSERIKKFAIEAGAEPTGYQDRDWSYSRFDHEKFARLIVGECLGIVSVNDDETMSEADRRARTISREIKEHFGVK